MKQAATKSSLRRLCPNIDKEDGLETVLEIPVPEEMFTTMGSNVTLRWQNMLTWMKAQTDERLASPSVSARLNELRFLLYLVGSPLIPLQVQLGHSIHRPVRDCSIVRTFTLTYQYHTYHNVIVFDRNSPRSQESQRECHCSDHDLKPWSQCNCKHN